MFNLFKSKEKLKEEKKDYSVEKMNKLANKSIQKNKENDLKYILKGIEYSASSGVFYNHEYIYHKETVNSLIELGFKLTNVAGSNHYYKISWE